MAEIQDKAGKGKKKGPKKQSTKIDMTPMVDLAFLLLTFFMLTTTFAKPNVMQISMPVPDKLDPPPLKESNALTIILGPNDKVFYYDSLVRADKPVQPKLHTTDYSANGIRKHLKERNTNPKLFVMIKPLKEARYKNMVDILDEMSITGTGAYALINDFTPDEKKYIKEQTGIEVVPAGAPTAAPATPVSAPAQ